MRRVRGGAVLAAAAASALLAAGPAAADPPPSVDPVPVVPDAPPSAPPDPFTAMGAQTQSSPGTILTDLLSGSATGANPADMLTQSIGLSAPSPVDPLASIGALTPSNYRMPSGDAPSPYVLQTGVPPGPFARVDVLKGVHAVVHGSLGRMPGAVLGQPLPGTAPPPGTNIPAGLEQFYADPAALPPPDPLPGLSAPPG